MDSILEKRLRNLSTQNDILRQAEGDYLLNDAGKKSMEADIFLLMTGTVAEKEAKVHASEEYVMYMKALAESQTKFNFERRRYEILNNAFIAELNTYKIESPLIKKGGST